MKRLLFIKERVEIEILDEKLWILLSKIWTIGAM